MIRTKSIKYTLICALAVGLSVSLPVQHAKAFTCGGTDASKICEEIVHLSDAAGNLLCDTDGNGSLSTEEARICDSQVIGYCDSDEDGYMEAEECAGITLPDGNADGGTVTYEMDPTQKDLFVMVVRADDPVYADESCKNADNTNMASLLPDDYLYPSINSQALSGLGLRVQVIKNSQAPDQKVGAYQFAVKMTESCSTDNLSVCGSANPGVPTLKLDGKVFTHVIKQKIESACDGATDIYEGSYSDSKLKIPSDPPTLIRKHIVNTVNHELGHMVGLSVNVDSKIGNHWKTGTGAELDQFVDCTSKGSTTTCYIPDVHPLPDIDGFKLR